MTAAFWCLASALASVLLPYAAYANLLPQHFFCCTRPEVAVLAFVVVPAMGGVGGVAALARIARSRGALKGWVPATLAALLGPGLASVGVVLGQLFKT